MLEVYTWKVNYMASLPLHEQLKNRICSYINTGKLQKRNTLPSTKALSKTLAVSEATCRMAYKLLEEEGYIVYIKGQGYVVSALHRTNNLHD